MLPGAAFKVYVNVFVEHTTEGLMLPRTIVWEEGDRYTIQVNGARTYLYFERSSNPTDTKIGRWFVERKVPLKEFL